MSKPIFTAELSPTLSLSEYHQTSGHAGFWLYDKTRGMNLAMGAPSREAALLQALSYYQKALARKITELVELDTHVQKFLDDLRKADPDRYGFCTNCISKD